MAAAGAAHPGAGKESSRPPGLEGGEEEMLHAVSSSPSQLEELKQQLELQEEELGRLRLGVVGRRWGSRRGWRETPDSQVRLQGFSLRQGATDSEKRVQHLTLENEALKQSLSLMRDLLLHWGPAASTRAPQVSSLATTVPAVWGF